MKAFLNFVEIRTKVASQIPFLFGVLYSAYMLQHFNFLASLTFFLSLLCLDMATTAWNNLADTNTTVEGYNYQELNPILNRSISRSLGKKITLGLYLASVALGLLLFLQSGIEVLLVGAIGIVVGLMYSYKGFGINHTPFAELASASVMGILIPFLAIVIQDPSQRVIFFELQSGFLRIELSQILHLISISLPFFFLIANLMLMNNISDMEEDSVVGRHTLPLLIGKGKALRLALFFELASHLSVILLVVFRIFPPLLLLSLVLLPHTMNNTRKFVAFPSKKETFVMAVKNLLIQGIVLLVLMGWLLTYKALCN